MLDRFGFDKKKLIAHNIKNKKLNPLIKWYFSLFLTYFHMTSVGHFLPEHIVKPIF